MDKKLEKLYPIFAEHLARFSNLKYTLEALALSTKENNKQLPPQRENLIKEEALKEWLNDILILLDIAHSILYKAFNKMQKLIKEEKDK